jgi:hypothetical protein
VRRREKTFSAVTFSNKQFPKFQKENYERQVQDLEDENEKYINELSQSEKFIEKLKAEVEQHKAKVIA